MRQMGVSLDDELRALLESQAQKHKVSVAAEIRRVLWESFGGPVGVRYTRAWLEQEARGGGSEGG